MFATPQTRRLAVAVLAVALAVIALSLLWPGSSSGAARPRLHVVRPGETVWSIVDDAYGGDPRAHLDAVARRNGLRAATIYVGERLWLP
jgi:hypothetical protein